MNVHWMLSIRMLSIRRGLILSVALHLLLLGLMIFDPSFLSSPKDRSLLQVVDVELISAPVLPQSSSVTAKEEEKKEISLETPKALEQKTESPSAAPPLQSAPAPPSMLVLNEKATGDAYQDPAKATAAARQSLQKVQVAEADKLRQTARAEETAKIDLRSDPDSPTSEKNESKPDAPETQAKPMPDPPLSPRPEKRPARQESQPVLKIHKAEGKKPEEKKAVAEPKKPVALSQSEFINKINQVIEKSEKNTEKKQSDPSRKKADSGPPLSLSERDGLVFQIKKCWSPPIGAAKAEMLIVKVHVQLTQDGWLSGKPVLVAPNPVPNRLFQIAFEEAARALVGCQPYQMPVEKYDQWRELEILFNPADMLIN